MSDQFALVPLPRRIHPTVSGELENTPIHQTLSPESGGMFWSWLLPRSSACGGAFRGGELAGALVAVGGDAFQQLGRRFVVRVLRDKLAGEGVSQDRLPQSLRGLQLVPQDPHDE